jgi:hypothetical protein
MERVSTSFIFMTERKPYKTKFDKKATDQAPSFVEDWKSMYWEQTFFTLHSFSPFCEKECINLVY